MLAVVDPATLYLNLMLLIGAVFLLGILFVLVILGITFFRAWLWARARRRAEQKWIKYARRADGRAYPATVVGTCDLCRRGGSHIYCEYGMLFCAMCYEKHWREAENWDPAEREAARAAATTSVAKGVEQASGA
jgi:hypothetical protein